MNQFETVPLSESKRPILLDSEIELLIQNDSSIYEGETKTKYQDGIVIATSHRVIWLDAQHKTALGLKLANVNDVEVDAAGWNLKASPKIRVSLKGSSQIIKFSFKSGGRDTFQSKMKSALAGKAWEKAVAVPTQPKKEGFTTQKAGVGGVMRAAETRTKQTDATLQAAFSDINALIDKAKEMVALSERFAAQQSKETKGTEEDSEMRSMLISMGIASPVTKESAGSLYHTQLSRQLADWLQKPLEKFGGMIALTDLYCLFNRARGTELISPDDLYRACVLFEELQLPVRVKKFDSGVIVVQALSQTDDAIAKQMSDLLRLDGPQTAFDVARTKNISMSLATEQLLTAEKLGVLCRDETFEGITFYLNFFNDLHITKLYLKQ